MSLDLIIGPMFSGKTTELIRRLTTLSYIGKKCLFINNKKDIRSNETYSTHNPNINSINNIDSVKLKDFSEVEFVTKYDVIGIDEAQLFDNLRDFVCKLVNIYDILVFRNFRVVNFEQSLPNCINIFQ